MGCAMKASAEYRFAAKVAVVMGGPLTNGESCWRWKAYVGTDGYGHFWDGHRIVQAHRWRKEHELCSTIPRDLDCDHLCRNRVCVNPVHIEVKTRRENVLAPGSLSPSAVCAAKAACPTCGGAYSKLNTGQRQCRICHRAWERNWLRERMADPATRARRNANKRVRWAARSAKAKQGVAQ